MPERFFNLVVPLPNPGTAMRIADTAGSVRAWSGAVSSLIGLGLLRGDVDSTYDRSTGPTPTMPGTRTSTMATRTTITSRMPAACAWSADQPAAPASFTFEKLVQAYFDCRKHKRNTPSALAFEMNLERNLSDLHADLVAGIYRPGRSICFVVTRPKAREVWAADFRDRVVHHLMYNHVAPRFHASFIADSCACIPGRGTMYAAKRLEAKVRSVTQNWATPAWYLKCDLANFFVSIHKPTLRDIIAAKVSEPWWLGLTELILFHDPRADVEYRGAVQLLSRVPRHKQLGNQPTDRGLPIGNLSSQFFANVLLDRLDQFVKHHIGARHYIRYVDDFVLLHASPQWLNAAGAEISDFLGTELNLMLNPSKTILQPVARGIDFVGQVIKPWHSCTRRRTVNEAVARVAQAPASEVHATANSYFGLLRQANHGHRQRAALAHAVMGRGHAVNQQITKAYRNPLLNPEAS